MKTAALSVLVHSLYMLSMGLGFLLIPNLLLPLLGLAPSSEVWIRVLGLFTTVAAGYYMVAAREQLRPFFRASVGGRLVFAAGILVFVALRLAAPIMVPFALFEAGTAFWTWWALRRTTAVLSPSH